MKIRIIKILKSIIIFLMFVIFFAGIFLIYNFFKNPNNTSSPLAIDNNSEFLFLLAGVDSTGEEIGTRTDTLMLVKANSYDKSIDIISIPRDSYVSINGNMDKINAAHSYGGIDLTMQVIREFLGINLDKYIVISFDAVIAGIDALGGIDIDVSDDVAYAMGISPGIHTFSGQEALGYVRFRKGYQNADIGRIDTQQDFLKQFVQEVSKPSNLPKLPSVYANMKPYIKTNIAFSDLTSLALKFRTISTDNIKNVRLEGEAIDIDGISYYQVYDQSIADIRNNYLSSYLR